MSHFTFIINSQILDTGSKFEISKWLTQYGESKFEKI